MCCCVAVRTHGQVNLHLGGWPRECLLIILQAAAVRKRN
jgi:hypothetical protein